MLRLKKSKGTVSFGVCKELAEPSFLQGAWHRTQLEEKRENSSQNVGFVCMPYKHFWHHLVGDELSLEESKQRSSIIRLHFWDYSGGSVECSLPSNKAVGQLGKSSTPRGQGSTVGSSVPPEEFRHSGMMELLVGMPRNTFLGTCSNW